MKWFTYCIAGDHYPDHQHVGLLFGSDTYDIMTEEDLHRITQDPAVYALFPKGFYVSLREKDTIIVSASSRFVKCVPDEAKKDDPPVLRYADGRLHKISPVTRYDNCRSLFKGIGCAACPDRGHVCFSRETQRIPGVVEDEEIITPRTARSMFVHRKSKLAGFTYASPVMTDTHDKISASARTPEEHDFGEIERWTRQRRTNSKQAAISRDFKKNNCKICPIRSSCPSWRYRGCEGRYASDEELTTHILTNVWPALRETMPWEEWQFWVMARAGGMKGTLNRKDVVFSGPERGYSGWTIEAIRTHRPITALKRLGFFEAAELFEFPSTREEAEAEDSRWTWAAPQSDRVKAIYILTTLVTTGNTHHGYLHGSITDQVAWRSVDNYDARVKFACSSYLRSQPTPLTTFDQFYGAFDQSFPIELPRVEYTRRTKDRSQGTQLELLPTS